MKPARPLRAVVTAGGTEEAVDDVRVLTNFSTGRFGAAIARALVRRGVETTVLASRALAARAGELPGPIRVVPYSSFRDLEASLAELATDPPDMVLMAAAVSDYTPVRAAGKIRSDAPSLEIALTANPKILPTLRGALGDRVVLVGFKLLSGVTAEELVAVARAQVEKARLDLTVANDLAELRGDRHPVWLVPRAGDANRFDGHREDVADAIGRAAIAIATDRDGAYRGPIDLDELVVGAADALGFAASSRAIRARSSGDSSHLLDTVEGVDALLMVDDALGRFDAELTGAGPPSDEAVRGALAEAARAGRWAGGPFGVRVEGGGALFGLNELSCRTLAGSMDAARAQLRAALGDAPGGEVFISRHAAPIFDGARVVGAALDVGEGVTFPFVVEGARGRGVGDAVLESLSERGHAVAARPGDEVFAFHRGFARSPTPAQRALSPDMPVGWAAGMAILEPPSRAATITAAASVALVDPLRRRVLLGKRLVAPFEGYWAFPGGKLDEGDSPRGAAARELAEETGIALSDSMHPRRVVRVHVSDGRRVFAVDCHVFMVLSCIQAAPSDELDAEWISIERARSLRPMAGGTRRVMREIEAMMAGR